MAKMKWGGQNILLPIKLSKGGAAYSGSSCFLYAKGGETV